MHLRDLLPAVLAVAAAQDPALLVRHGGDGAGPAAVSCGLSDMPLLPGVAWRAIELEGAGHKMAAIAVRRPGGVAVRAVGLPGGLSGETGFRIGGGRPELPASRLRLDRGEASWESGGLAAAFRRGGAIELRGVRCGLLPRRDGDGAWRDAGSDPVRSVLVWDGDVGPPGHPPGVSLYAVLHAGAPEIALTLVVRVRSHAPPPVLGLAFHPADEPEAAEVAEIAESHPAEEEPAVEPGFPDVMEGLRTSPWESVPLAGGTAYAAVRRHGPTAPVAREPSSGSVRRLLAIDPAEAPSGGETRVLRLRLCAGPPAATALARPGRLPPRLPFPGAIGSPSECPGLARVGRRLEGAIEAFRADPRHGLLHRRGDLGDWRLDSGRVGNLEWDSSLGFALRFLDRGDPIDAWQAIAGVEHLLLLDRDPASGLFFQHGPEHRSGVVEPGHHWCEGIAVVASWLDDPWLLDETARLAADQVRAFAVTDLDAALPRSLGWALTALCALHDFCPDRAASRATIERIERFLLRRQGPSGHFMIEASTLHEGAFRISPFVDGGILVPALERASRITRRSATREALRRARSALLTDAVVQDPDGPRLVSSVLLDSRGARVIGRGGSAEGEEILLFLAGVGGGARSDAGLVRRAEASLALERRTYLGKPISMLMRALPAYAASCR